MSVFANERATIRQNLLNVIANHPSALKDDASVVIFYWHDINGGPILDHEVYKRLEKPESITREVRRMIEDGIVQRPPEVQAQRQAKQHQFREHYGGLRSGL